MLPLPSLCKILNFIKVSKTFCNHSAGVTPEYLRKSYSEPTIFSYHHLQQQSFENIPRKLLKNIANTIRKKFWGCSCQIQFSIIDHISYYSAIKKRRDSDKTRVEKIEKMKFTQVKCVVATSNPSSLHHSGLREMNNFGHQRLLNTSYNVAANS